MTMTTDSIETIKELARRGLTERPAPIYGSETVQLIIASQAHQHVIFRTEDDKRINSETVPVDIAGTASESRVAMLATKPRGAETRRLEAILRSAVQDLSQEEAAQLGEVATCHLKDHLCMRCPRCVLFGATTMQKGAPRENIKHRIGYDLGLSLRPYDDLVETLKGNGVDALTQSTGQTLLATDKARLGTVFLRVVTLSGVTVHELVLAIKTILSTRTYGAETRANGRMRNAIVGVIAGRDPICSTLDLVAGVSGHARAEREFVDSCAMNPEVIYTLARRLNRFSGLPSQQTILTADQVDTLVGAAADQELDLPFLQTVYGDARSFFQNVPPLMRAMANGEGQSNQSSRRGRSQGK